ncbi:EAL domain-containing protein [Cognatiluteimonas telluris]|jgi:EAL domain-containing protein (putative c-di-GMP-specific phosphodiesterase class I)|uniref:EAL domain-containing protein n=1 Tax=Cognatiluteimonas telluris TaxID=1104775 RepID=UPI00140D2723|nr:EAL domain-containing protein [Lysobacter telluris]
MAIRRELFAGEVLYRQGEPSDCAWLVERGTIELVSVQGRREISHGVLGQGELIGELGMLDGAPRSATAIARGDTVLLAIEHDQFLERLESGDPIVRTLVDSLLQRTRSIIASLPADVALPAEDVSCDDPVERSGIEKIRMETQLREALDTGALEVRYQPLYDIPAGRVSSYEALVRWELPERGAVSPGEFIKLAEETSLIVPVGEYVLDRVIAVLVGLRDAGVEPLPSIAVNLSARQLVEPGMARQIVARVQRAQLPKGALKLEVTESRMLDYGPVHAVMQHCRENGIPFALDDFGTGYSNLTHLYKLDFEFIKVDQAFARHMFETPRAMALVESIVAMAHALGAQVITEGVETLEQLQRLREMGVRYAQGYLVGQAQPAEKVLSGEAARVGEAAARG